MSKKQEQAKEDFEKKWGWAKEYAIGPSDQDLISMQKAKDRLEAGADDEYLEWQDGQPDKVKAIIYHHRRWQNAEISDYKYCDKVAQVIFKDVPIKRVVIIEQPPKPGSNI